MEEQNSPGYQEQEGEEGGVKQWLEDNLRILLSILVVLAIAGGIYSYSQRAQAPQLADMDQEAISSVMDENTLADEDAGAPDESVQQDEPIGTGQAVTPPTTPTEVSRETANAFVETAAKGNGTTHLARRALANHLEKNPDSQLTKEHKIYIEDYLRKHAGQTGSVHVGTSVEFQKSLITEAIGQAKTLNDAQLENLKKYSARVPSLS